MAEEETVRLWVKASFAVMVPVSVLAMHSNDGFALIGVALKDKLNTREAAKEFGIAAIDEWEVYEEED